MQSTVKHVKSNVLLVNKKVGGLQCSKIHTGQTMVHAWRFSTSFCGTSHVLCW